MCLSEKYFEIISMSFNSYFFREKLKVEVDNKGRKMCMNQMRLAFSSCRVPGVFRDQLMTQFRTGMCALGQV